MRALGRPAGFVPSEDTIVRNRAHALRERLASFYVKEGAGSAVHIELPKGSYIPRFVVIPEEVHMRPSSSLRLGDAMAALAVGKVLDSMGVGYQVLPDRAIVLSGLQSRNAILIGDPTLTPIIGQELQRTAFSIDIGGELCG